VIAPGFAPTQDRVRRRRSSLLAMLVALCILGVLQTGQSTSAYASAPLTVVASTTQIEDFVAHVGGERVNVLPIPAGDDDPYDYLTDLTEIEQRPVFLIWDGLPAHCSRRMSDWLDTQRDWLSVEQLPGYAPDLNPIEQASGNLKSQELANLCRDTIDAVANVAENGLDRIGTDAQLCFAFLHHSGLRL
jgi:DDE superfamily endonuclease